ncbi:MAG: hypothetical protein SVW02_02625 [Candidatus Nanohaloarchaea archaeon]|nr:hypothetical protein [Candidatus Nanohaloarchaea archaeon]
MGAPEFDPLPFDRLVDRYVQKLEEDVAGAYDDVTGDDIDGELAPARAAVEQEVEQIADTLEAAGRRLHRQLHAEAYGEVPDRVEVARDGAMTYRLDSAHGTRKLVAAGDDEQYDVLLSGRTTAVHPQVYALARLIDLPHDLAYILEQQEDRPETTKISVGWTKLRERGVRNDDDELAAPLSADALQAGLDRFAYEYWAEYADSAATDQGQAAVDDTGPEPYETTVEYLMAGAPVVVADRDDEAVIKDMNGVDVSPRELEGKDVTVQPISEDGNTVRLLDVHT